MMKRIAAIFISPIVLLSLVTIFIPYLSISADDGGILSRPAQIAEGEAYGKSTVSESALSAIVGKYVNAFLSLLGTVFLVLLVSAGYKWMTAAGNEENVEIAKDIIFQAIIGLMIVIAALLITNFILASIAKSTIS